MWFAISFLIIGIVLVLLPDNGEAIIEFNQSHGPSMVDLIGLFLFSIGWIWLTTNVILRWKKVMNALGRSKASLLLVFYFVGVLLIIIGLRNVNETLLWTGVILALFSNAVLVFQAFRSSMDLK